MTENAQAPAASADPFSSVADAMVAAAQAVKDGAADARESVGKALPATQRFVSKVVYTLCYSASYGLVFPTLYVTSFVPTNNPLVNGFVDGASAARDTICHYNENRAARREASKLSAEAKREENELIEEGVEILNPA